MAGESTYDIGGAIPKELRRRVPAGTSLLVTGADARSRDVVLDSLCADGREGSLFITEGSVEAALADCAERAERYWCVACEGDAGERAAVVPSPDAVPELAAALARLTAEADEQAAGVRLGIDSLDSLLAGAEPALAFRFLHVLTGRVRVGDMLAVAAFTPAIHDRATVSNVRALFDAVLELRVADGRREARLDGLGGEPTGWVPME